MLYKQTEFVDEKMKILCVIQEFWTRFTRVRLREMRLVFETLPNDNTHINETRERKYPKKKSEHKCLSKQVHVLTTQKTYRDVFPFWSFATARERRKIMEIEWKRTREETWIYGKREILRFDVADDGKWMCFNWIKYVLIFRKII